jgi:hypothetical protein
VEGFLILEQALAAELRREGDVGSTQRR